MWRRWIVMRRWRRITIDIRWKAIFQILIDSLDAHVGQVADLFPLLKLCTLDIICGNVINCEWIINWLCAEATMGKELGAQMNPNQPYVSAIAKLMFLDTNRFYFPIPAPIVNQLFWDRCFPIYGVHSVDGRRDGRRNTINVSTSLTSLRSKWVIIVLFSFSFIIILGNSRKNRSSFSWKSRSE